MVMICRGIIETKPKVIQNRTTNTHFFKLSSSASFFYCRCRCYVFDKKEKRFFVQKAIIFKAVFLALLPRRTIMMYYIEIVFMCVVCSWIRDFFAHIFNISFFFLLNRILFSGSWQPSLSNWLFGLWYIQKEHHTYSHPFSQKTTA